MLCSTFPLSCHTHALTHNQTNTDKQVCEDAHITPSSLFRSTRRMASIRETGREAGWSQRLTAITSSSHTIATRIKCGSEGTDGLPLGSWEAASSITPSLILSPIPRPTDPNTGTTAAVIIGLQQHTWRPEQSSTV